MRTITVNVYARTRFVLVRCRQRQSTFLERPVEYAVHKIAPTEIFLRNVRDVYPTLPKKIRNAVDRFAARIEYENRKVFEINSARDQRPKIGVDKRNNDVLNDAWRTIGDLNLKTTPNFKPSDGQTVSLEDKYRQYAFVRQEVRELVVWRGGRILRGRVRRYFSIACFV